MTLYAHNTQRSGPAKDIPVVVERDHLSNPWFPHENAADWHEASNDEYNAYLDYWRPGMAQEENEPDPDDYNDMMKDLLRDD